MERHRFHPPTAQIPVRGPHRPRLRSTSSSNSDTSNESRPTPQPMAVPGVRYEDPPPPLPPPRYNEELDEGIDTAWNWGNRRKDGTNNIITAVKSGSSLYGGYSRLKTESNQLNRDQDMDSDEDERDGQDERRSSNVSTIRSISQAALSLEKHIPKTVPRPSSPSSGNQRLQGERPLAQESWNRYSHAYDQQLLSKIGKSNSPTRNQRSESIDGGRLVRKLSLQTTESSSRRQSVNDPSLAAGEPITRWVSSPISTGYSPGSQNGWRDHHHHQRQSQSSKSHRRTSMDGGAILQALDPELFARLRSNRDEDLPDTSTRSPNGIHDQKVFTDLPIDNTADEGALGLNSRLESPHSHIEQTSPKQGTKRRASSPLAIVSRDDKSSANSAESHYYSPSTNAVRSPITRFQPKYGSVSSTSSSIQHNSYASSVTLSTTASSLTSVSSLGRNSPLARSQLPSYSVSGQHSSTPITSNSSLKNSSMQQSYENPSTHAMSDSLSVAEQPAPPSHRIGIHYICECCPKKPKKFDKEGDLRAHQMEKQYSCQYCNNRFKNKNEAERHQNSLHLRRHSWSCAAIPSYHSAFHPSTSNSPQGSTRPPYDTCGFCGEEFPNHPQPDWDLRIDHLTNIHKFGECNQAKKFYRADHFRQHLKHSHAGQSGKWTNLLENVCLREETLTDASGLSPTGSDTSQSRGPSSLPAPADTPMGGITIDEAQEET